MARQEYYTLAALAYGITRGNLATMAKLLNDTKAITLDELKPDPGAQVSRSAVIELIAMRAGDIVGRRAVKLLGGVRAEAFDLLTPG